jgi:hypothetical protein
MLRDIDISFRPLTCRRTQIEFCRTFQFFFGFNFYYSIQKNFILFRVQFPFSLNFEENCLLNHE